MTMDEEWTGYLGTGYEEEDGDVIDREFELAYDRLWWGDGDDA